MLKHGYAKAKLRHNDSLQLHWPLQTWEIGIQNLQGKTPQRNLASLPHALVPRPRDSRYARTRGRETRAFGQRCHSIVVKTRQLLSPLLVMDQLISNVLITGEIQKAGAFIFQLNLMEQYINLFERYYLNQNSSII